MFAINLDVGNVVFKYGGDVDLRIRENVDVPRRVKKVDVKGVILFSQDKDLNSSPTPFIYLWECALGEDDKETGLQGGEAASA